MSKLYKKVNDEFVEIGDEEVMSSYRDHIKLYGIHLIINTRNSKSYYNIQNGDLQEVTERVFRNLKLCVSSKVISNEIYSKVSDDIFKHENKLNYPRSEFIDYLLSKDKFTFPSDYELIKIILHRLCEYDHELCIESMNNE